MCGQIGHNRRNPRCPGPREPADAEDLIEELDENVQDGDEQYEDDTDPEDWSPDITSDREDARLEETLVTYEYFRLVDETLIDD